MKLKTILKNSRFKFVNSVRDVKDIIDSYNETAEIPELDGISESFNDLINTYDNLVEKTIFYVDENEEVNDEDEF